MKRKRGGDKFEDEPPRKKRHLDDSRVPVNDLATEMEILEKLEKKENLYVSGISSEGYHDEYPRYRKYEGKDYSIISFSKKSNHSPQHPPPVSRTSKIHQPPSTYDVQKRRPPSNGSRSPPLPSSSSSSRPKLPEVNVDFQRFGSYVVTRDYVLSLLSKPYMNDVLRDCFVRYAYKTENGRNFYRIGLIRGVGKKNAYSLHHLQIETDVYILLHIPEEIKSREKFEYQSLNLISNSPISREEWFELLVSVDSFIQERLDHVFLRRKALEVEKIAEEYRDEKNRENMRLLMEQKKFELLPTSQLTDIDIKLKYKQSIYIQEHEEKNPEIDEDLRRINEVLEKRRKGNSNEKSISEKINERNRIKNMKSKKRRKNQKNEQPKEDFIFQRKSTESHFFNLKHNYLKEVNEIKEIKEKIKLQKEQEKVKEEKKKEEKKKKEKENFHDFDLGLDLNAFGDEDIDL